MIAATTEKPSILNLLSCKIQINIWESLYFNKGCTKFAEISISCEDELIATWNDEANPRTEEMPKYYIHLLVDCKSVSKLPISQKAFEALSIGQPSALIGDIQTFSINQFVPAGSEVLNELEYE